MPGACPFNPYVITRRVNNPIRQHWFARHAYRRAACVAAVAPQVAEVVSSYDAGIHVVVVHSSSSGLPVDDARARQIRASFPNKLVVGHVGALDNDQKGQVYIVAVARELEASCPDLQFVLVGGGEDEAMLKAEAAGLENVLLLTEEAAKHTAQQFQRESRPANEKDWPALLRMLDRKGIDYRS